ncbi:MAG: hypothetical protein MI862_16275 [Desulfobacterales bacterium]|nr:hypothetical protein [Desulfobacterales bacterium]
MWDWFLQRVTRLSVYSGVFLKCFSALKAVSGFNGRSRSPRPFIPGFSAVSLTGCRRSGAIRNIAPPHPIDNRINRVCLPEIDDRLQRPD